MLFIGTQFSNLYTAVDTPARGRVGRDRVIRVQDAELASHSGSECIDGLCCILRGDPIEQEARGRCASVLVHQTDATVNAVASRRKSAKRSHQVRTFLKVYMELGS